LIFAIFDRNFAKIVAPTSDENENYIVIVKEQSGNKRQRNACSNYATSNARCSGLGTWPTKRTYKHHIFLPTAGAHCAIFPELCVV